jgi:hypothetical protein
LNSNRSETLQHAAAGSAVEQETALEERAALIQLPDEAVELAEVARAVDHPHALTRRAHGQQRRADLLALQLAADAGQHKRQRPVLGIRLRAEQSGWVPLHEGGGRMQRHARACVAHLLPGLCD